MQSKTAENLPSVLTQLPSPVFVANFSPDRGLTLHVCRECDASKLNALMEWTRMQAGGPVPISVQTHSLRTLAHPRSLEHWLKQFGGGEVVHDPAQIASRASGLLLAAKSCRAALGRAISGSFFDPDHRTLFVLARRRRDITPALCRQVADIVQGAWKRALSHFERGAVINVQVVADLPARALLPVDSRSASVLSRIGRTIRRWLAPTAVALALAGAASPAAARLHVGLDSSPERGVSERTEFGILSGLSVFADGQRWYESRVFANTSLRQVFGSQDAGHSGGILLAQAACDDPSNPERWIDPNCTAFLRGS